MNLEELAEKIGDREEITIGEFLKLTPIDPKTFPADIEMKFPVIQLLELYSEYLDNLDKKNASADEILDGSFLFNSINESINKSRGLFAESNDPFQESLQLEGRLGYLPSNTFAEEKDDFPRSSILQEFKTKRFSLDDEFKVEEKLSGKISFGQDVPEDDPLESRGNISFGQDAPQDSPAKISFGNDVPQESPVKFSFKATTKDDSKINSDKTKNEDSPAKITFNIDIPQDSPVKTKETSAFSFGFTARQTITEENQSDLVSNKYEVTGTHNSKKSFDFSFGNDIPKDSPVHEKFESAFGRNIEVGSTARELESRVSFQKELESDSFFQKKNIKKGLDASYYIANTEVKEFGSTFGFNTTPVKKDLSKASNDEYLNYLNSPIKENEWEIKKHYVNILDSPGTFEKSLEKLQSKIPVKQNDTMSLLENESIGNLGGFKSHSRISMLKKTDYSGSPLKNEYKSILESEKFADRPSKIPSPSNLTSPVHPKEQVSHKSPLLKENGNLMENSIKKEPNDVNESPATMKAEKDLISPLAYRNTSNLIGSPLLKIDSSNLIGSPINDANTKYAGAVETKENVNLLDISNLEQFPTPSKKDKAFKSNLPVLSPRIKKEALTEIENFKEFTLSPMKSKEPQIEHEEQEDFEKISNAELLDHDTSMNIGELNESKKSQDPIPPSMKPDIVPTNPFEDEKNLLKLDDKSIFEEQGQLEESKDPKKLVYQVSKPISPRHMTAFRRKYSGDIDISPESPIDQLKKENRRDSKSFGENHSQQFKDKIEYWKQTEQEAVPDNLSQSSISIETSSIHDSESQIGGMVGAIDPDNHLELENRKLKKQLKKSHKQLESMEKAYKTVCDDKDDLEQKVVELEDQKKKDSLEISNLKEEIRELNKLKNEEERTFNQSINKLTQTIKDLEYDISQKDRQINLYFEQYDKLVEKHNNEVELEGIMNQLKNAQRENEKLQHLNSSLEQEINEIRSTEVYEVQVDEKWVENRIKQVCRLYEEEKNLEHILCDTRHELYQRKLFMAEAKDWVNEVKTDLRHCTNNVSDVNSDFEHEVERAKQMKDIFFEMVDQKKSAIPECLNCKTKNEQSRSHVSSVVANVFDDEQTKNEQYSILQQEQYQLVNESQMSIATPGVFEQKKTRKFTQINMRNFVIFLLLFLIAVAYNLSFEYEDHYYQVVDSIFGPPDRILI
ncbi:hypothetical protein HK103_007100 [Boothiomyces macroporosus]|uniref:Uncharacterized protein n=1 Tax=Boothiomyces macroporosus TaxID=261099 RepID=A0AAD5UDI6_9FUNG|nr:hypothetical protein HK103_007100 [Boothiomyces macroporosus]